MAEEIVLDNVRVRPTDGERTHVFDMEQLGLTEWGGMHVRVVPNGNPPWSDAQLDGVRFTWVVEDGDSDTGPWTVREKFDAFGAYDSRTGPRTFRRFVRSRYTSGSDNRVTIGRILPG